MPLYVDDEALRRLAGTVIEKACERGLTLGTAESCTGGLVAGALTAIPGSSAAVRGGIVSYDPEVKHNVLGVARSVIDDARVGVVSRPCAESMAEGALRLLGCDVAVSVTGIAGPSGAEPGKPVGTVWFGLSTRLGVHSERRRFEGSRDEVRSQAVSRALGLLREGMVELSSVKD